MYPIEIDFRKKRCVIIGAGKIAMRRAEILKNEGALITVVAPEERVSYFDNPIFLYKQKPYEKDDLQGAFMVIAATDDVSLNKSIVNDAREMGILVSSVTKGCESDVTFPSVCKNDEFTVSVSTNGSSPAFARELCRETMDNLEKYRGLCEIHQIIRNEIKNIPQSERHRIMREISSHSMCKLYSVCGKEVFMRMARLIYDGKLKKTMLDEFSDCSDIIDAIYSEIKGDK